MIKVQGQDDEVPRSVIGRCSGWRGLCNVSGLVQVALQSLEISNQMPIRTRLCSVRIFWSAMESVTKRVVSLKAHHCQDIGKQVCEDYNLRYVPGVAFGIFCSSQRPQIFKYLLGRHCILLNLIVDKCWRRTRGKIAALYNALEPRSQRIARQLQHSKSVDTSKTKGEISNIVVLY